MAYFVPVMNRKNCFSYFHLALILYFLQLKWGYSQSDSKNDTFILSQWLLYQISSDYISRDDFCSCQHCKFILGSQTAFFMLITTSFVTKTQECGCDWLCKMQNIIQLITSWHSWGHSNTGKWSDIAVSQHGHPCYSFVSVLVKLPRVDFLAQNILSWLDSTKVTWTSLHMLNKMQWLGCSLTLQNTDLQKHRDAQALVSVQLCFVFKQNEDIPTVCFASSHVSKYLPNFSFLLFSVRPISCCSALPSKAKLQL